MQWWSDLQAKNKTKYNKLRKSTMVAQPTGKKQQQHKYKKHRKSATVKGPVPTFLLDLAAMKTSQKQSEGL